MTAALHLSICCVGCYPQIAARGKPGPAGVAERLVLLDISRRALGMSVALSRGVGRPNVRLAAPVFRWSNHLATSACQQAAGSVFGPPCLVVREIASARVGPVFTSRGSPSLHLPASVSICRRFRLQAGRDQALTLPQRSWHLRCCLSKQPFRSGVPLEQPTALLPATRRRESRNDLPVPPRTATIQQSVN